MGRRSVNADDATHPVLHYRLVAWVNYHYGVVYVRFIGTHRTYDTIDPQAI